MRTSPSTLIPTLLLLGACLSGANCEAQADDPRQRAVALVREVARAYRDAPALIVERRITTRGRWGERPATGQVALGPGADARVVL